MRSAADAPETWSENRSSASRGGLFTAALVFVAAVWISAFIGFSLAEDLLAWDVRFAYLPAADAVLAGESPYPELDDPILEDQKGYVYPPQLVVALLPLTALPVDLVALLVAIGMLALVGLTLWILDIRDVRCYATAFLWMPAASGVLLANVSIPLALAVALVWRYRDAVWPPAVALGLAVSAKLLLWPMFFWMLATRRLRTTVWAVLIGLGVTFAAWAAIGFAGFGSYPDLVRRLSEIQSENSYSIVGMAATLGLSIATFRYVPRDLRDAGAAAEEYLNTLNETLLARLKTGGELFVTNAVLDGRFLLRACIVNFRTTEADVTAIPAIVARTGRAVDAELRPGRND